MMHLLTKCLGYFGGINLPFPVDFVQPPKMQSPSWINLQAGDRLGTDND